MVRSFLTRLGWILIYIALLLGGGVLGYVMIEGWSIRDALYMTVVTLSAVGYDEVHPLSEAGRSFTMVLIFAGVSVLGIWIGLLTSFIVETDLARTLKQRKVMKTVMKLSDHIIVCGAGRTGSQVVEELLPSGRDFVVIERDPAQIADLLEDFPNCLVIEDDATQDQTLHRANIEHAASLVASLSSDMDNVYVALSARSLNPELTIVARAYEEESVQKLYRAGADHVVSPNVTGALRMTAVLLRPSVVSFLDVATRSPDVELRLEEATVSRRSPLCDRTIKEAQIRDRTGLMIIALRKVGNGGEFTFNPVADTRLEAGDELIVLGTPDQIQKLQDYAGAA